MRSFQLFQPTAPSTAVTKPQKVAIYRGSFDPPHVGHQEVIQYCLTNMACEKVYIVANEPNKHKPARLDYSTRKAMLNILFQEHPHIVITDADTPALIQALRSENNSIHIVNVMGSDGALIMKDDPTDQDKFDVDSYIVIPRVSDDISALPDRIAGKICVIGKPDEFHHQQHSSTVIRRFLSEHDHFYSDGAVPSPIPIPPSVLQIIRERNLYRDERSAILQFLRSHPDQLPDNVELSSLTNATQSFGGLSGDAIYLLRDTAGNNALVIKAFHGKDAAINLRNEVTAIQKLHELSLSLSSPLRHYFYQMENNCAFMAMEIAKGVSLTMILEKIKDKSSPTYPLAKQTLKQSIKLYARAFAELHSCRLLPITELSTQEIKYFVDKIHQIYASIIKHHDQYETLDLTLLKQYIDSTIKLFLQNPGFYSYTHGDPNLGNFFIQLEENHLTMLDTAHLAGKWMDSEKNPKGFAANEYLEACSAIGLIAHRFSIPEADISECQEIFKTSYMESAKKECVPSEALNFFNLFWLFREINTPLRALENYAGRREFEPSSDLLPHLIDRIKSEIAQPHEHTSTHKR